MAVFSATTTDMRGQHNRPAWLIAATWTIALASAAHAQGSGVTGRWIIAKAQLAPWANPLQTGGPEEERRLVGRTVTFGAHRVVGPQPLGCRHARFKVHDDTPDLLFEGSLAEPDRDGKPRNAVALAHALGMRTKTVRTLETSCSEVAYHRLSPAILVFGLNNRIYTLHPARTRR